MNKAPCIECPDRQLGCHDCCEKYREYKEYSEDIKKKMRQDNEPAKFLKGESYNRKMAVKKRGIK
ncbi:MAG: hypothetical protein ACI4LC_05985 [Emergencia sp.]